MHIALYFWGKLPVDTYGGTQRVVVNLARGLAELGHQVTLLAAPGSKVPEARVIPVETRLSRAPTFEIEPWLPHGLDILVSFVQLRRSPETPWIWQLSGNRRRGQHSPPNTLHVSADHARRHGSVAFAYNGIDPRDYVFRSAKADYDLFLGRLHRAKGYQWAIAGARRARLRLLIAGGWRPTLSRHIRFVGRVGGASKATLLAGARCLWMPALWDEPFGLTLVEALVSGTPILGTRRGALPEIVRPEVGALGDTLDDLVRLRPTLDRIRPEVCREWVERWFTHRVMAEEYVRMIRHYVRTGNLPQGRLIP
jgi:glycosyltransferase involved in cell wall biosynthesis